MLLDHYHYLQHHLLLQNQDNLHNLQGRNIFWHNEKVTVKILNVNANEELSLQYHHNRDEFWKVISGTGNLILGNKIHIGNVGDEFFIKREERHQIKTSNSSLSIL